ncbi:hypothetical protein NDI38_26175 [Stenomitos frigidus AS-A4]|uniref:Uncharacterized protein n=1 Tax=Stenomitos frigidus AS-A4 TaxID=2933935 RepID=A0ABV0KRK1_9CYAN|nr:hypothetical protein [Phormidium sp. FACHB-592]
MQASNFWKNCASCQDLRLDHLYFTTTPLPQERERSVEQQVSTFEARGVFVMF